MKFESFAATRMRGAIFDDIRDSGLIPRLAITHLKMMGEAHRKFAERGLRPTLEELSGSTGLDHQQMLSAWGVMKVVNGKSVGDIVNIVHEDNVKWIAADSKAVDPYRAAEFSDLVEYIIKPLSPREKQIVVLYYLSGLGMQEVGDIVGLSESRVSQMMMDILQRTRERREFAGQVA